MSPFEIEAAKHYYAGKEKTHISIYPVIVLNQPDYNINLKSAFFDGHRWRWQQIFTGEEDNIPLKTWKDVIELVELELKRLSSILTPLFEGDKLKAWGIHQKINGRMSNEELNETDDGNYMDNLIAQLTDDKYRDVEQQGNSKWNFMEFLLDDPETSLRTKIEHWLPVWIAWKTFYDKILIDYKSGKLKEL